MKEMGFLSRAGMSQSKINDIVCMRVKEREKKK